MIGHTRPTVSTKHMFRQTSFVELLALLVLSVQLIRCRYLIINVLMDALRHTGYIDLAIALRKEKNSNLAAVNLHHRRPSSISTSKISHLTKNGDWFLAYNQSDQFTHVKPVTDRVLNLVKIAIQLQIIIKIDNDNYCNNDDDDNGDTNSNSDDNDDDTNNVNDDDD